MRMVRGIPVPPSLWYENEEGERWIPPEGYIGVPSAPEGFTTQVSQFPHELKTNYLKLTGGRCVKIIEASQSWTPMLVEAMVKRGIPILDAIMVAATACSRCINAWHFDFNVPGGYSRESLQFEQNTTRCEQCDPTIVSVVETTPA